MTGIAAIVLTLAVAWVLFVPAADWLARHDVGSARGTLLETARDNARGRLLTLGAGVAAAGAILFTARNFTLSRRTFELTEQGQVTERYTKAIEQLGSDKLDVRIGGIYALERIARDSARDHQTIVEVLTTFIREHSRERWPPPDVNSESRARVTRPDIQAAVTVIGRRDKEREIRVVVDLTGVDLSGADLSGVDLSGVNLSEANLSGANLRYANLAHAGLNGANLHNADLILADFSYAQLRSANLSGANLQTAGFSHASLNEADLINAQLGVADFMDDYLALDSPSTNLIGTILSGANLTGVDLTRVDIKSEYLVGAIWPDNNRIPSGWKLDTGTGRLVRENTVSGQHE